MKEKYRYNTVYSQDGDTFYRQATSENQSEWIVMERDIKQVLECERDQVEIKIAEFLEEWQK